MQESYGLRVEVGDNTDTTRVTEAMLRQRPDVVIHLAALTGIAKGNETHLALSQSTCSEPTM